MESPTEHESATQENMFEDPAGYAGLEAYEPAYEASEESPYEPEGELSEDALEPIENESVQDSDSEAISGSTPSVAAGEPHPEPAHETVKPDAPPTAASNPVVAAEPESMTVLTVDDFTALEERILRAVSLVRRERQARVAAEERTALLEVEVQAQIPAIERLQQEVDSLRAEREQVRQRVERLLGQLDAMEL
jgi:FtsZ-binding cell division protein ZapB